MATLNFTPIKMDTGNYLVFAVIRDKTIKDKVKKSLGFTIENLDDWDGERQRPKKKYSQFTQLNKKILEWERLFTEYEEELEKFDLPFNVNEVLQLFGGESFDLKNPGRNLTDLFLRIMESLRLTHVDTTVKKYEVLKDQVLEYELNINRKILLPDVHKGFYTKFAEWLIKEKGNNNKTILRKIKMFRTVMRFAVKDIKVFKGTDWDVTLNLKDVDANKVPLKLDEIELFLNYRTTDLNRRLICDAFITSMYTGLRYSDLQQLSQVHFQKEGDLVFINLSMIKTTDKVVVPVPPFLLERLRPYLRKGKLFDLGENSLMNKFLKAIAKDLELNRKIENVRMEGKVVKREIVPLHKAISFHFGRYTYIYLLDTAGLQATYIQANAGHRDMETTQGYLQSDTHRRMVETVEALQRISKAQ